MLSILRTNKFKDCCYIPSGAKQAQGKPKVGLPTPDNFWTIQEPNAYIINSYKDTGCELRIYGNKRYLLSPSASKVISTNTTGSGASGVLSFEHDSSRYYIFVVDNKTYLQNPQGGRNPGESGIDNLKREIKEELGVETDDSQYEAGGYWEYTTKNPLIGFTEFSIHNDFFYVNVDFKQVSHLVTKPLVKDRLNIFHSSEYSFALDETQYVVIASQQMIFEHSDIVVLEKDGNPVNHNWNGHHREIILRKLGYPKYDIGYHNFNFVFF